VTFCVLVIGTKRRLSNEERARIENVLRTTLAGKRAIALVKMGDCPNGVDQLARHYCEVFKIPHQRHFADWAMNEPVDRPTMMVAGDKVDLMLAFPDRIYSKSTWECMVAAIKAGVPAYVYPLG
jgi:hypothetical protein